MTTTPDDVLNIDDWLDGLTPPEATLDVCGSANLAARHEDLTGQCGHRKSKHATALFYSKLAAI